MLNDLQYAARTLRHNPLIAGVAILTLALGIGASAAVFSVVDAVLLRPLPFHDPDRLVRIHAVTPEGDPFSFADAAYLDLIAGARTLERVAAFREVGMSRVLAGDRDPERIVAVPISASAEGVLGVHPAAGRMFTPDEDRRGAEPRVVLGHRLWQRRFRGDMAIIGRSVMLDDTPFVVTGIMPPGFDFPDGADAWVPLAASADRARDDRELAVFARLAPGATLAEARAELRRFGQQQAEAHAQASAGWSTDALPFSEWLVAPRFREAVWVLLGAVAAHPVGARRGPAAARAPALQRIGAAGATRHRCRRARGVLVRCLTPGARRRARAPARRSAYRRLGARLRVPGGRHQLHPVRHRACGARFSPCAAPDDG